MIEVKKVVIVLLLCILSIFIATSIKLELVLTNNQKIQKNIDNLSKENDKINEDNSQYEENIKKLKEENKEKWEELEIWLKTKEKIQKALS